MMKASWGWFVSKLLCAMFLLASSTADGYGQIPLTVTPNAGNAMPNPAFTNETVT